MRVGPRSAAVFVLLFLQAAAVLLAHRWMAWYGDGPGAALSVITAALDDVPDANMAARLLGQWDAGLNARHGERNPLPVRIALVDAQGHAVYRSAAFPSEASLAAMGAADCAAAGPLQAWCRLGMSHRLGTLTLVYPGVAWARELRSVLGMALASAGIGSVAWLGALGWFERRRRRDRAAMERQWALRSTTQLCRTTSWGSDGANGLSRVSAVRERLESRLRRERAFVQDAAHELKTPLATLRAQVHQLRAAAPKGQPADPVVQAVDRTAQRMARMTEQLLHWSRLQDGDPEAVSEKAPVDVVDLIREGLADLAMRALDRRIDLALDAPQTWWGSIDAFALDCVVRNLVDNAIRYGHDGGQVRVVFEPLSPREARLVVEDDGPGIAAEHRERVFERFFRATDHQGGSGLGLSIVKLSLPRIGGQIELQTGSSGQGCSFSVRFECIAVRRQGGRHADLADAVTTG